MAKKITWLVLFLWAVSSFSTVLAATSLRLERLDQLAENALQSAQLKHFQKAEGFLLHFSDQMAGYQGDGELMSMDELRIMTAAHEQAVKSVKDDTLPDIERIQAVTQFRLVMDAVESSHDPLWTALESQVLDVFSQTKSAAAERDGSLYRSKLDELLSLYSMLYPSLKVDLTPGTLQQLDARIRAVSAIEPENADKVQMAELDELETELQRIFDEISEDEADPSLWWVIISTGSIIIMTLSYVGWRKYQAQQRKHRKGHND